MAGLGRRTFAPGEVLTASNVMNFLQDQVVQNYAGTAARGSAIGSAVSEGMVSYLADTNSVQVYDGSAWQVLGKTTGGILQVQQTVKTDTFSASVTTGAQTALTGLTVSITPISTTSKLLINFNIMGATGLLSRSLGFVITANTSAISAALGNASSNRVPVTSTTGGTSDNQTAETTTGMFLFSPASVTSQTIGINLVNLDTGTQTLYVNRSAVDGDNKNSARAISTLTVMEVSA
jgi:hypothetical protein